MAALLLLTERKGDRLQGLMTLEAKRNAMRSLPLQHAFVEPDAETDGPPPAVIVLHGRGADEQDLLPVAEALPDELATVSLRAPDPVDGGYRWYEIDASGGLGSSQPHPEQYRRSLNLAGESIQEAVDEYGLDPDRIGLAGFSMGTMVSTGLVLEHPDTYAWLVGLHGYLPELCADLEPDGIGDTPVFFAGGDADRIIPVARVAGAARRFGELGADVTYESYDTGHGIGGRERNDVVEFVRAVL